MHEHNTPSKLVQVSPGVVHELPSVQLVRVDVVTPPLPPPEGLGCPALASTDPSLCEVVCEEPAAPPELALIPSEPPWLLELPPRLPPLLDEAAGLDEDELLHASSHPMRSSGIVARPADMSFSWLAGPARWGSRLVPAGFRLGQLWHRIKTAMATKSPDPPLRQTHFRTSGPSPFLETMASSKSHTCGLRNHGTLSCWGRNKDGLSGSCLRRCGTPVRADSDRVPDMLEAIAAVQASP
jgi:hypothetical protein